MSYGINATNDGYACFWYGVADSLVQDPSKTIYIGDSANGRYYIYWSTASQPRERYLGKRHNGGANILFFDGHANWAARPQCPNGP